MSESFLETIKVLDGKVFHIEYHQKRYESVLASLGIFKFKDLQTYLKPPSKGLIKCRVIYDTKSIKVTYHDYKKKEVGTLKLVYDDAIKYDKKSTIRDAIDSLYEKKGSCDDVLIVKNSLVCDTSIANVAFYKDGVWHTPKKPLLNGTTRERLLDDGKIVQKNISVEDLSHYSKIAILNAMLDFDIIQKNLKDVIC